MDPRIIPGTVLRIAPSATREIISVKEGLVTLKNHVSNRLEFAHVTQLDTWIREGFVTVNRL